jgi:hypothetical protein
MAEQVSFYDKLKSDMDTAMAEQDNLRKQQLEVDLESVFSDEGPEVFDEYGQLKPGLEDPFKPESTPSGAENIDSDIRRKREAAVRFATDPELARDEELLESFVRDQRDKGRAAAAGPVDAFRAMGVDVPASMKVDENTADFLNMFDDIEDLLASERGQTDLAYRRNLLDQRDSLMYSARRSGQFGVDVSPFARASLGLIEDPEGSKRIDASIDPITERTYSRKLERMKSRPERFKPAPDFERRFNEALAARDRLLQVEQMSPGPARDDAMMEARRAAKKAAKAAEESVPRSRRIQEARALPPAGDQLGLYQRAKQAVEQSGTEAVGAARRTFNNPALKKGARTVSQVVKKGAGPLGAVLGVLGAKEIYEKVRSGELDPSALVSQLDPLFLSSSESLVSGEQENEEIARFLARQRQKQAIDALGASDGVEDG